MLQMQNKRIPVLAAGVFLACAWLFGPSGGHSAARADGSSIDPGPEDIYAASCAACHGSDGRARTAKGKRAGATDLTRVDWNTDETRCIRIITNGKGQMPAFKGKLTPQEIREVFGYVLGFRK